MMGIRVIQGTKVPINFSVSNQPNVKDPVFSLFGNGKGQLSVRCLELAAMTGAFDNAMRDKVINFASNLPDDAAWTKDQVSELVKTVGSMPFPRYLHVESLSGQGSVLMRVVYKTGLGVVELTYPTDSNRPSFNALPIMTAHGMKVPADMCLEVPVALVLDDNVLKLELKLLRGEERVVKHRENEEDEAEG